MRNRAFEIVLGLLVVLLFLVLVSTSLEKQKKINALKTQTEILSTALKECNNNNELFSRDEFEFKNRKKLKDDIASYIKIRYSRVSKEVAKSISESIMKYTKEYNMPPELIVGMIEIESRFNPMAVSSKDARGLMQVMPEWVPKLKIKNVNKLHDIDTGIEAGIKVLTIHLKEAHGNVSKALYLYVGRNSEYSFDVYSAVGRFVTYKYRNHKSGDKK